MATYNKIEGVISEHVVVVVVVVVVGVVVVIVVVLLVVVVIVVVVVVINVIISNLNIWLCINSITWQKLSRNTLNKTFRCLYKLNNLSGLDEYWSTTEWIGPDTDLQLSGVS